MNVSLLARKLDWLYPIISCKSKYFSKNFGWIWLQKKIVRDWKMIFIIIMCQIPENHMLYFFGTTISFQYLTICCHKFVNPYGGSGCNIYVGKIAIQIFCQIFSDFSGEGQIQEPGLPEVASADLRLEQNVCDKSTLPILVVDIVNNSDSNGYMVFGTDSFMVASILGQLFLHIIGTHFSHRRNKERRIVLANLKRSARLVAHQQEKLHPLCMLLDNFSSWNLLIFCLMYLWVENLCSLKVNIIRQLTWVCASFY